MLRWLVILLVVVIGGASSAKADGIKVLVLGQDAARGTAQRNTPVLDRAIAEVSAVLRRPGVIVYDETAINLRTFDLSRTGRSDAELIETARLSETPIDAIAVIQIFLTLEDGAFGIKRPRMRLTGRLIEVRGGQALGTVEDVALRAAEAAPILPSCNRRCVADRLTEAAVPMAGQLGETLASTLLRSKSPCSGLVEAIRLSIVDLTTSETSLIVDFLEDLDGNLSLRLQRATPVMAEIWLDSCRSATEVHRQLATALAPYAPSLRQTISRNHISIERIAVRGAPAIVELRE